MLHNSHMTETILPSDWLTLFPSKFQHCENEEDTPQGGAGGMWEWWCKPGCMWGQRSKAGHKCMQKPRAPSTGAPPITGIRNSSGSRGDHEEDCRGGAARGGGEVTTVIANLTVSPDGCGAWAIYIWWESQLERSSILLWEAKPPRRKSWELESWRWPGNTDWGSWLFMRSASSKRAQSSLSGNCPFSG